MSLITIAFLLLSSCGNHDPQPTLRAFEGNSARLPPEGTLPYGDGPVPTDRRGYPTGMKIDENFLLEGEALYQNNCVVCHGYDGRGEGIAVKRGLTSPPSFLTNELKEKSPDYFISVMVNGKGRMPSYARRLSEAERWKVAAYVKALEFSQDISVEALSKEDRGKLP